MLLLSPGVVMKEKKSVYRLCAVFCAICFILSSVPIYAAAHPAVQDLDFDGLMGRDEAYYHIVDGLSLAEPSINVRKYGLKSQDVIRIIGNIFYHRPELFYFSGSFSVTSRGDGTVIGITPEYLYTGDELTALREEFDALAQELYDLKRDGWSDRETILFYHDYIADNFDYVAEDGVRDAYLMLKRRHGVCQAYTALFMLMMNYAGIPCSYVKSEVDLNHIWNIVYLDGAWYHIDVTWDDPRNQSPGTVYHEYFLTGADSIARDEKKSEAKDLVFGAPVEVNAADHPMFSLIGNARAPFVFLNNTWYGVTQTSELASFSFENLTKRKLLTLQNIWRVPFSDQLIPGNYSGLCTDGVYLYYNTEQSVCRYDTRMGTSEVVGSCEPDTMIVGLRYTGAALTLYTGLDPYSGIFTPAELSIQPPVFHTVTWVIGDQIVRTSAPEGSDPADSFTGSTYREDEGGVRYIFAGWSPELAPVTEDVVYTALYNVERLYKQGDANGDNTVSIADVTVILAHLGGEQVYIHFGGGDVNDAGEIDITDITALLTIIEAEE